MTALPDGDCGLSLVVVMQDAPNADYAHMMQLRKSRWMGTQIIQIGA
jgi:hypothetical protein